MPDTNEALMQAILDDPDDDGVRLVYADWLEEHGHTERAAFIRVQCELARLPEDDSRRTSLEAKERELLPAFAEKTLVRHFEKFLDEPPKGWDDEEEVRRLCREHRAVPILFDQGGWYAVRLDGIIVGFDWGEHEPPWLETDLRSRNGILFQATEELPDLWLFIPPRPATSRECHRCHGTGGDCRFCGGLKWVP
jgi:uncharacterized protein (TIGR02996 family)